MPNSGHHIDYERLSQDAMRGVVRKVLELVLEDGLPGNHHFYIAFNTRADGIGISKRLRDQYPEEMTIVLQHRFWDLAVHEDRFEVKLTFNSIPERLVVPYKAIKVFYDPSVPFGLQFEHAALTDVTRKEAPARPNGAGAASHLSAVENEDEAEDGADKAPASAPRARTPALAAGRRARPQKPSLTSVPATVASPPAAEGGDGDGDGDDGGPKPSAEVVKLDRFRKK